MELRTFCFTIFYFCFLQKQTTTEESSTVTGSQQPNPTVTQQTVQNTQTMQNFPSQTMTQTYQQPQNYMNQQVSFFKMIFLEQVFLIDIF